MKKTAWTLVAACAVVLTAAVIVCCRGGRPSELDDIPPDSEQFVMTPDTGNRCSEPKSGEDVQNLVIIRETPLEAGTNRSDRVAMLGTLDDITALKMASRSLQGTPGSARSHAGDQPHWNGNYRPVAYPFGVCTAVV